MPRSRGFSNDDVRRAMRDIRRQGFRPSITTVRDHLGGGATALIGERLRLEFAATETAEEMATGLTLHHLFEVLMGAPVSTVKIKSGAHTAVLGFLMAELKDRNRLNYIGFRDYVEHGLRMPLVLIEIVLARMAQIEAGDLAECGKHMAWLRVYLFAADNIDIGQLAIFLGEEWLNNDR